MIYTDFHGEKLSLLGFGTMRLPLVPGGTPADIDEKTTADMVRYAMEHGVNYFDTAYPYHGGMSERVMGRVLKDYDRGSFYLATKYPGHQLSSHYDPAAIFEEQLEKCGVDYFDFYLLHNVYEKSIETYTDPRWGIIDYFLEQKKKGRIRHLGFSTHGGLELMERFLSQHGKDMEFCQIQLNYLDWTMQDAKAKCELLPNVRKENGLVVLNADDPMLTTLRGNTPVQAVFCGKAEDADYRAQVTGGDGVSHIHCHITTPKMERDVKIPALGEHMIYPTLIAAAVGEHFGLTPDEIEDGIARFVPTRMRMNVIQREGEITILDDSYNANPQSMRAAISVLADTHSSWKVAILGDMFELGPYAPALHAGVGDYLGKRGNDCLVAGGKVADWTL